MNKTKKIAATAVGVAAVTAGLTAGVSGAGASTSSSVTGRFARNLLGFSRFVETDTQITVYGGYAFLPPNGSFFTVAYGNTGCDPAQAFPVGPFTTDANGFGYLNTTVPDPTGGIVAGTYSVSVRIGDDATDIDKDGKTGPTDVVAVPNSGTAAFPPSPKNYKIGLVQCDRSPRRP